METTKNSVTKPAGAGLVDKSSKLEAKKGKEAERTLAALRLARRQKTEKRRRTTMTLALGCLILSGLLYSAADMLYLGDLVFVTAKRMALLLLAVGSFTLMFLYLNGELQSRLRGTTMEYTSDILAEAVDISRKLEQNQAELEAEIGSQGSGGLDGLQLSLDIPQLSRAAHVAATRRIFRSTPNRLLNEVATLSRRGNVNLSIGAGTTVGAIGWLVFMVVKAPSTFHNVPEVLAHYIPRITTVVFIEVFAFFFLRLYRNGLSEMRYYQDQLTHFSKLEAAFEASLATDDLETKKIVINHLASPGKVLKDEPDAPSLQQVGEFIEKVGKVAVDTGKKSKGD